MLARTWNISAIRASVSVARGGPSAAMRAGLHPDQPVGEARRQRNIVQHHQCAGAAAHMAMDQLHDFEAVQRVERGHRLVGEQQGGLGGKGARAMHARHLAAGQGVGAAPGKLQQVAGMQRFVHGPGIRAG